MDRHCSTARQLIIVGAGGFGREVYWLARDRMSVWRSVGSADEFEIKGFLDDNPIALRGTTEYPPVVGAVATYEPQADDVFICALGNVRARRACIDVLRSRGAAFVTLVHPSASINPHAVVGAGCLIMRQVVLSCEVTIGDYSTLQAGTICGHDVKVGRFCQLNARVFLGGGAVVEDDATLHVNSIVHPGKRVGRGATVGAGSFVIRHVKPQTTVVGNPARTLT